MGQRRNSTLQYVKLASRGSSSVNCRNPTNTVDLRPTSTDSESTPKNPKKPVRNRVDFRADP
eukprot:scaffold16334_cov97-Phaeocystis_antarctica.AAC.2